MRSPALIVMAAAVLVTAGTPMVGVKPATTTQQQRADAIYCQQEAWREARLRGWYNRPFAPVFIRDPSGRAVMGWPYGPAGDPFGDPYLEENRLTQFCMRAKGYEL